MTEKGGMTYDDRKHEKMAVCKEIVRNTKGMRKRLGHSIGYGKKETVRSLNFWRRYCIRIILTELSRELRRTKEHRELTE